MCVCVCHVVESSRFIVRRTLEPRLIVAISSIVESRIQDQFVDGDGLINYQEFVRAINEMASNKQ